jgi:hypothetical protein
MVRLGKLGSPVSAPSLQLPQGSAGRDNAGAEVAAPLAPLAAVAHVVRGARFLGGGVGAKRRRHSGDAPAELRLVFAEVLLELLAFIAAEGPSFVVARLVRGPGIFRAVAFGRDPFGLVFGARARKGDSWHSDESQRAPTIPVCEV